MAEPNVFDEQITRGIAQARRGMDLHLPAVTLLDSAPVVARPGRTQRTGMRGSIPAYAVVLVALALGAIGWYGHRSVPKMKPNDMRELQMAGTPSRTDFGTDPKAVAAKNAEWRVGTARHLAELREWAMKHRASRSGQDARARHSDAAPGRN